jgi:hypothetical protein
MALLSISIWCAPASAVTPFAKAFDEKYVKNHPVEAFRTAFKKTRCNVCHVKGEPKTVCNAYGNELAKFIEGNAEERIRTARAEKRLKEEEQQLLKELNAAFDEVEKVKTDGANTDSPTYGDKIRAGELPTPAEPDDPADAESQP